VGFFDDIGDAFEDVAEVVAAPVVEVAEVVAAPFVDVAEAVTVAVEDTAEAAGGLFEDVGEAVVEAGEVALDAGGSILDAGLAGLDDTVFDAVDYATFGAVEINYEDGNFSANAGIDGIFDVGLAVGENGFDYHNEVLGQGFGISATGDGFNVSGQAGIDWGPLPYVEGHVSVDEDGNFGVGGEATLYVPTPGGLVGGHVEGDFQQTNEGWEAHGGVEGGYISPVGAEVKAGVDVSAEVDADGYHTEVGGHVDVGIVGGPHVGASVEYEEGREGDVTYSGVQVEGSVSAPGVEVAASGGYTHVETPDGEYDVYQGGVSASAGGAEVAASGEVIAGPDGVTTTGEVTFDADAGELTSAVAGALGDYAGIDIPDLDAPGIDGFLPDDVAQELTDAFDRVAPHVSGPVGQVLENVTGVQDVTDLLTDDALGASSVISALPDVSDLAAAPVENLAEQAADMLGDSLDALSSALDAADVPAAIPDVVELADVSLDDPGDLVFIAAQEFDAAMEEQ
jgi:hypothetical protein